MQNFTPPHPFIRSSLEGDGIVRISANSLIGLRVAAQNISFSATKVKALQTGSYYSPFRGRGMEFDEVRPYQPGDDVRTMDWRVTARTGKPHTKLFREERERSIILWVDFRAPMFFATQQAFKSVMAAKAAALFAWGAIQQGDRLGGLLFSETSHLEFRPQRGKLAVLHFLQKLAQHSDWQTKQANHNEMAAQAQNEANQHAFMRLRRVARPGSLIVLISDFRNFDQQIESHLAQLSRHNEVALICLYDPLEATLPPAGYYRVSDKHQAVSIDTTNANSRRDYQQRFDQHIEQLRRVSRRYRLHFLQCATSDDIVTTLQQAFGTN